MKSHKKKEPRLSSAALTCLLLGIAGCGGDSSASSTEAMLPPPPPPSTRYSLAVSALNPAAITAGQSATATVTVTPLNGYQGTVQLTCTVSGGVPAPGCSFNKPSVAISSAAVTSTLKLATAATTPGGKFSIVVNADDATGTRPTNGPQTVSVTNAAVIKHVVIIFQENRTPDNLFHDPVLIARGADIASSGIDSAGQSLPLKPIDLGTTGSSPQNYDLDHSHNAFVTMYDGGKMDGADQVICVPATFCPPLAHPSPQFKYVLPSDVQPYFALAEQYTFGDRMFQTNQGPSFPAHQFILAGTSAPTAKSSLFAVNNPISSPPNNAGCLAPAGDKVKMIDATGSMTNSPARYPCFEHPTLSDLVINGGLTWRYYAPSTGSIWTAPNAIDHICQVQNISGTLTCAGSQFTANVIIPQTKVLSDIANGELAAVTWVIPDGKYSDHPSGNDGSGPSWVAAVVNAIGSSSYWANTAIIITWDDWGGWYDHVKPKVIDDGKSWGSGYVYGFRVPLIVVSPYAKASYISHRAHDFGSILKYIETTFNLPSLNYADGPADDLADCFDLTQSPLAFHKIPAPLDGDYFINDKRPSMDPDTD
jgi:phospholipase C